MSAFNPYYPSNYPSSYPSGYPAQTAPQQFPTFPGNPFQQQTAPAQMPTAPQTQNSGGFVRVQNEQEARLYPVAPGNSITFIDDYLPYCYVKTMDVSQLDRPKFEKYRLVKEEDMPPNSAQNAFLSGGQSGSIDLGAYALKADLNALATKIAALQDEIENATPKKTRTTKKESEE